MPPAISVVMASYNRGHQIGRAISSVLDQDHRDLELVVVDSSSDGTPDVLRAMTDPRLRVFFDADLGMTYIRNRGIEHATGEWIAFLDDDDSVRPGWAGHLLAAADDRTGMVLGGMEWVDPDGRSQRVFHPSEGEVTPPVFMPGSFLALREAVVDVGGMLEGLPAGHHWELAVRLVVWCREHDRTMALVDRPVVEVVRRPATNRTMATPIQFYDGMRWLRARHAAALASHGARRATFASNTGVPAARLGEWREARRWFTRAVLDHPTDLRHWGRLASASLAPLGRRVWGDQAAFAPEEVMKEVGVRGVAALAAARGLSADLLMLPYRYVEREPSPGAPPPSSAPRQAAITASWRAVDSLVDDRPGALVEVVDQDGLASRLDGLDVGPAGRADVVVLPSVLEVAPDPYGVLRLAIARLAPGGHLVVSTPDRRAVDGPEHLGPTGLPDARRLWSPEELRLVLDASQLAVDRLVPPVPQLTGPRRGRRARPIVAVTRSTGELADVDGRADLP